MNDFWNNLSKRERRLAMVTLAAILAGTVWMVVLFALRGIGDLNDQIEGSQQELVNFRQQLLRQEPVDAAFSRIASEHSSKWTTEEIRDGLHKEIYRLALRKPPAPNAMTAATRGNAPRLVDIPSLPDGVINTQHEGYREYALEFRIQPAPIGDLVTFLSRLQESPQVLRVEELELNREPEANVVSARIRVTRTVVDGIESPRVAPVLPKENLAKRGDLEHAQQPADLSPDWLASGCDLAFDRVVVLEGETTLKAVSTRADARLAYAVALEPGQRYRVQLSAVSIGSVELGLAAVRASSLNIDSASLHGGAESLTSDGIAYTYTYEFTMPETDEAELGAVCFVLKEPGTVIYVDALDIRAAGS